MLKVIQILSLSLLLCSCADFDGNFQSGNQDSVERGTGKFAERPRIWALVVGVSQYDQASSLNYADDDAIKFAKALISNSKGPFFTPDIELLLNQEAKYETIKRELGKLLKKARAIDQVVVYFAGHGVEGAFLPADYDGCEKYLHYDELLQTLSRAAAKSIYVFADACYSGSLLQALDAPESAKKGVALDRLTVFASSSNNEVSLENAALKSGVYSYHLVRGMQGEADFNQDNKVSISELVVYSTQQVKGYTAGEQHPVWWLPKPRA